MSFTKNAAFEFVTNSQPALQIRCLKSDPILAGASAYTFQNHIQMEVVTPRKRHTGCFRTRLLQNKAFSNSRANREERDSGTVRF